MSPTEALEHLLGCTAVDDITTRDLDLRKVMPGIGTDRDRSENVPGLPLAGPVVVPAESAGAR